MPLAALAVSTGFGWVKYEPVALVTQPGSSTQFGRVAYCSHDVQQLPGAHMELAAMKTWIWPAALVLALAGCSTSNQRPVASASPALSVSADQIFLAGTSVATFSLAGLELSDADLIKLGHLSCSAFDGGVTWSEARAGLTQREMPSHYAELLMASAINAYCGEHKALVK